MRLLNIAGRNIGSGFPVWIVAEVSANHMRDYNEAVRLIGTASDCGADAVKLQTYTPDTLTVNSNEPEYIVRGGTPWDGQTLYDLYSKAYMPWEWQPKLKKVADDIGIPLFSSVYDKTSVDFLEKHVNPPCYKIAAPEIVDLNLISYAAITHKPVILSMGDATGNQLKAAVEAAGDRVALLHYIPRHIGNGESHLLTIPWAIEVFGTVVGISNHCSDPNLPAIAVALGAQIIEQHFTIRSDAIDAAISMTPQVFAEMVDKVRLVEREMIYGAAPQLLKRTEKGRCYIS
jgi:sialic acid synthase SpsE